MNRANAVVVTRNWQIDVIGIAIGIFENEFAHAVGAQRGLGGGQGGTGADGDSAIFDAIVQGLMGIGGAADCVDFVLSVLIASISS